ncbi:hypothetical protein BEWA_008880 [Theileria equi strain WA]|uniref:AP2/ERF domain-containing protein n=1 Tax=Theileria equi strain WA TaxID=1537102 RepID=L0B2N5_THEEQ|nr:hypothetical protein BEWA_008880 [Theileria equi strain WA]AFZ81476.1 hypothetical protein BEWA_008880 [Theileria equi strain WA]|eukprot:XP_004831142.1 hypothetical protein BEWA_008880 [Theileria equi strain WA]
MESKPLESSADTAISVSTPAGGTPANLPVAVETTAMPVANGISGATAQPSVAPTLNGIATTAPVDSEIKQEVGSFTNSPQRKSVSFKSGKRSSSKRFIIPPPRATPSSSSGFPGVSWNKRMGAWLAFYYDQGTRRSRTFHPKYFDMDVEKAKLAAIDFMNNIEKQPRCSLRKNRREKHENSWANNISTNLACEYENQYQEIALRKKRNKAIAPVPRDFLVDGIKRSPLSCSTQASIGELYFDALRPRFLANSALALDASGMGSSGANLLDSALLRGTMAQPAARMPLHAQIGNGRQDLHGDRNGTLDILHNVSPTPKSSLLAAERKDINDPGVFSAGLLWGGCHNVFMNGHDYGHSSQDSGNFSLPSFDADYGFTSPANRIGMQNMIDNSGMDSAPLCIGHMADYENSPLAHDDPEIRKLVQSIAPSDSFGNSNFSTSYNNCSSTSISSPYMSPYTVYNAHAADESALSMASGFQNLLMPSDSQVQQHNHRLYSQSSPFDILPIDSS